MVNVMLAFLLIVSVALNFLLVHWLNEVSNDAEFFAGLAKELLKEFNRER